MNNPRADDGDVLLTGATGFLGMELLARYLEHTDRDVLALVRASDQDHATARIEGVLELLFGRRDIHRGRVRAVAGNIEQDALGLGRRDRDMLCSRATEIVHCAATVSFQAGLAESREINVHGTQRILELARRCAERGVLRRVAHISTAYVAGKHDGVFAEHDIDVGQRFRNAYERSKFEAERLVRSQASELPAVTILRPSIVVGESTTGWTPAFNVLYIPLRAFAAGKLRVLPAAPSAPVDVVPVDYVADAIIELARRDEQGVNTYHLVAGEHATTVGRLVELSARHLDRRPPLIVPPRLYRATYPLISACAGPRGRTGLRRAAPFLPYYSMRVRYERHRAAAAGLRPPPLESFYPGLLDYAAAASWGKHPLPRPHATA
jgi:thioester reductase-like protein